MSTQLKKIAVFVEGQTELIFLSELLKHLFTEKQLNIEPYRITSYQRIKIESFTIDGPKEYSFMIIDCGTDDKVKSQIIEDFSSLKKAEILIFC